MASPGRKALALALSALLVMSGCSTSGIIDDDATPMASYEELALENTEGADAASVEDEAAGDEATDEAGDATADPTAEDPAGDEAADPEAEPAADGQDGEGTEPTAAPEVEGDAAAPASDDTTAPAPDATAQPAQSADATAPASTDNVLLSGITADTAADTGNAAAGGFTDYSGLSIKGGTAGTDYALESVTYSRVVRGNNESAQIQSGRSITTGGTITTSLSSLVIKKSGTYTIKNTKGTGTAVSTAIYVAPGINVDITLAGVNISTGMPFNIATNSTQSGNLTTEVTAEDVKTKTTVHLTLADGTVNTLYSSYFYDYSQTEGNKQFPGLRCGEGSVLTIDDEVRNVDTSGKAIVPEQGLIPAGTTYVDRDGKTVTSTGAGKDLVSSLSNLASRNVGHLKVYGGIRSAAIGGGPMENSGYITINGGEIRAEANGPTNDGSGCGIGGGHAGGSTKTTINGGHIVALGSLHGAGIGGGCTYVGGMSSGSKQTAPFRDALLSRNSRNTIAGDITINGGFVEAKGWLHSNAFGQGCGGNNEGKTILITGGTLLPSASSDQVDGFMDIGGNSGYVIITGGSVFCGTKSGRFKFQGNDNDGKAYGDLARKTKVSMLTVNVKPKIEASAKVGGVTPDYNAQLESWDLLIDKFATNPPYGAPATLNDGKLYLWLKEGINATSQVDANFSYYVGDTLLKSNTTLPTGSSTGGDTVAKEWETFELDKEFVGEKWSKYYDGLPLTKINVAETPIPVNNPAGGRLDSNNYIKYNYQQMKENGDAWGTAETTSETPFEAGLYDIEVRSEQYKSNTAFNQTYWGHVATGQATIAPVTSKTSWNLTQPIKVKVTDEAGKLVEREYSEPTWIQDENAGNFNTATNNHLVVPIDVTSDLLPFGDKYDDGSSLSRATCLAPTGSMQLYIDGRPVPERLGGIITFTRADLENPAFTQAWITKDAAGREHTMARFDMTRSQLEAFGIEDRSDSGNEHHVYVKYNSVRDNGLLRSGVGLASAFALPDAAPFANAGPAQNEQAGVGGIEPVFTDSSYVNYYESKSSVSPVEIELAVPDFDLFNEFGTGYIPNGEGLSDAQKQANDAKLKLDAEHQRDFKAGDMEEAQGTEEMTDVSKFRDETDDAGNVTNQLPDWFPLYVKTNSIGDIEFTSSNPGVIAIEPNDFLTDREYVEGKTDYGVGAVARVLSAGKTTITATIKGTGAYSSVTKSFDIYVYPDLAKKPELSLSETSYVMDRDDGTVRPGDTVRYTTTAVNEALDSACINPVYELGIPKDTTFKGLTVIDPSGNEVPDVKYRIENGKVVIDTLPTLFGGQEYQFKLDVTVNSDGFDPRKGAADLKSTSKVSGIYGVNPDKFSWDDRIPADGLPVEAQTIYADPTEPDPNPTEPEPIVAGSEGAMDILGGELIEEAAEPIDPANPDAGTQPKKPGVPVGDVDPDSPFAFAKKAHPDDPTRPDDPADPEDPTTVPREPILKGDRIVSFGDVSDPEGPGPIADELEKQIKQKIASDPEATYVDIPVTIERPNPEDPDNPTFENMIVTVPITPDMKPDPNSRNDHDVVIIPADVDPRAGGDIDIAKSVQNVTPGYDKRANQGIAMVGDTVRYTIKATNTKPGSAWYNVIIKDPLPEGVAYVAGSAVVRDSSGTEYRNFTADYDAASRTIGFCLGDLYGVGEATVTFDCTVTPEATGGTAAPANTAYAFGTEPSTTVRPNPGDPDGRVLTDHDPVPPGPYNPDGQGKTWDDVEKESNDGTKDVNGIDPNDPVNPPVSPMTLLDDVFPGAPDPSKLSTTKSGQNLVERADGSVHVGDIIRYTVTVSNNDAAHTMWYNVVIEDTLPAGLNPVAGSMKLTLPDGTTMDCPDEAYSERQGNIAVFAGNLRGGQSATLVFEAAVTTEAVSTDIGNVGRSFGSSADELPTPVLKGEDTGGMPPKGTRFDPGEGWEQFVRSHDNPGNTVVSGSTYPAGFDGTVRPADPEELLDKKGKVARVHDGHMTEVSDGRRLLRLAQTGDTLGILALGLTAVGVLAGAGMLLALYRRRPEEEEVYYNIYQ